MVLFSIMFTSISRPLGGNDKWQPWPYGAESFFFFFLTSSVRSLCKYEYVCKKVLHGKACVDLLLAIVLSVSLAFSVTVKIVLWLFYYTHF